MWRPREVIPQFGREWKLRHDHMTAARRGFRIAFAIIFALLGLNAWAQVLLTVAGRTGDPPALFILQFLSGAAAAAAAAGIWKGARWAPVAALGYGIITACMIAALEPILGLEREARTGLWIGAVMVLLFSALSAWYLRRSAAADAGR